MKEHTLLSLMKMARIFWLCVIVSYNAIAFAFSSPSSLKTRISGPTPCNARQLISSRNILASSSAYSSNEEQQQQQQQQQQRIPDIEQLKTAPFMKQVQYGNQLTAILNERTMTASNDADTDEKDLKAALQAQLSHSDGIRGFMVSYLTTTTSGDDEGDIESVIPGTLLNILKEKLQQQNGNNDLVSLLCMNVIMPTAMITMHQDPIQSKSSAQTAYRGTQLVKGLLRDSIELQQNLQVIYHVAATVSNGDLAYSPSSSSSEVDDTDVQPSLIRYWTEFFDKWGYQEQQRKHIQETIKDIIGI